MKSKAIKKTKGFFNLLFDLNINLPEGSGQSQYRRLFQEHVFFFLLLYEAIMGPGSHLTGLETRGGEGERNKDQLIIPLVKSSSTHPINGSLSVAKGNAAPPPV